MQIRPAGERGFFDHGWLKTWHSFSFAGYYNPDWMGFGSLRVINDDTVAPGGGFPMHPHRDMEILTYVINGSIQHRDSMGHESVLERGEIQVMSAGSGIVHSEYNHSNSEELRLLQIWIIPASKNLTPRYDQRNDDTQTLNEWQLLAAPPQHEVQPLVVLHADALVSRLQLEQDSMIDFTVDKNRIAWLQVVSGSGEINGRAIQTGDGIAVRNPGKYSAGTKKDLELLRFDLGS